MMEILFLEAGLSSELEFNKMKKYCAGDIGLMFPVLFMTSEVTCQFILLCKSVKVLILKLF